MIINFKEQRIGIADSLSTSFYSQKLATSHFKMYKNRIVLPVKIGSRMYSFFYDCGASMFTLQTTAENARDFAPKVLSDTLFNMNNGEAGTVHNALGGAIDKPVTILGKRYEKLKVFVEPRPSPIFDEAKVAGLIGNKLFLSGTVVIDFRNNKFIFID